MTTMRTIAVWAAEAIWPFSLASNKNVDKPACVSVLFFKSFPEKTPGSSDSKFYLKTTPPGSSDSRLAKSPFENNEGSDVSLRLSLHVSLSLNVSLSA